MQAISCAAMCDHSSECVPQYVCMHLVLMSINACMCTVYGEVVYTSNQSSDYNSKCSVESV